MANTNDQVQGWYNKYLGRGYSDPNEGQGWLNDPNAEENIKNSGEAKAWSQKQPMAQPQPAERQPYQATPAQSFGQADNRSTFYNITGTQQGSSLTPAQLKTYEPQLKAAGFSLVPSADGTVQKIRTPNGMIVDVIQGAMNGQNTAQWLQPDQGDGSSSSSGFGASASGIGGGGVSSELYRMLLERAHQGTTIDKNDPNIKQQVDPYVAQIDRQKRNYLSDMAEGLGPNANLTGQARVASEHAGQQTGLFQSQLIGRELQSRRDQIQQALSQLGDQLSTDQQQALTRELAQIQAASSRYGVDAQSNIANNQLGLGYNYFDWARDPANPSNIPNFNSSN